MRYRAVYANPETAQPAREQVALAMTDIMQTIAEEAARALTDPTVMTLADQVPATTPPTRALRTFLVRLRRCPDLR